MGSLILLIEVYLFAYYSTNLVYSKKTILMLNYNWLHIHEEKSLL